MMSTDSASVEVAVPSESAEADGPQLIVRAHDGDELLGYVVVDTTADGRSHGGVRMHEGVTVEELRLLARAMTLKYGYLGLDFGGAKAGVLGNPEAPAEARRARLASFGKAVAPLLAAELFVPAADMGTTLTDVRVMLDAARVKLGRRRLPDISTGEYTAHSVFAAAEVLARHHGRSLATMTVAIQGFGKVGARLARLLSEAGSRIVAVSTSRGGLYAPDGLDVEALVDQVATHGSDVVRSFPDGERIELEQLLALDVQMIFPCAQHHAITAANVDRLRARLLCPAANAPWPVAVEKRFETLGIGYLPEFATNGGGVLGAVMAYAGFSHRERVAFVRQVFGQNARCVLERAAVEGVSVREVAERLVDLRRAATAGDSRSPRRSLSRLGLALHRRGLLPTRLVRACARPYLRRRALAGLSPQPTGELSERTAHGARQE